MGVRKFVKQRRRRWKQIYTSYFCAGWKKISRRFTSSCELSMIFAVLLDLVLDDSQKFIRRSIVVNVDREKKRRILRCVCVSVPILCLYVVKAPRAPRANAVEVV